MFETLYDNLLNKVSNGDKCVMLTYLTLHDNVSGSIENKIFLTKDGAVSD